MVIYSRNAPTYSHTQTIFLCQKPLYKGEPMCFTPEVLMLPPLNMHLFKNIQEVQKITDCGRNTPQKI